jgi:hypothetical protein
VPHDARALAIASLRDACPHEMPHLSPPLAYAIVPTVSGHQSHVAAVAAPFVASPVSAILLDIWNSRIA